MISGADKFRNRPRGWGENTCPPPSCANVIRNTIHSGLHSPVSTMIYNIILLLYGTKPNFLGARFETRFVYWPLFKMQTCLPGVLISSVVDPDPHRDGENGSGTDPGSIKGSQNKGERKFSFYHFVLDL